MPVPKKNVAYTFAIGLVDSANRPAFKANPTIAAGDFKVSKDGGAFANLTNLPSAAPASGRNVEIVLTSTEMNADRVVVQCVDAAGSEWDDVLVYIDTTAVTVDDLVRSTTPANTLDVSATGEAGVDWSNVGSPTTTLNLSGTTISTTQAVASVSGAVGSVTGNVGGNVAGSVGSVSGAVGSVTGNVGGNVVGSVGSVATGGITASSFAAGAIDAAAIAADAIGSSELAASAASEIATAVRTELATELARVDVATSTRLASASYTAPLDAAGTRTAVGLASANLDTQLSAIAGYIDTEVAAIKAVTDQMVFTTANRLNVQVYGMEAGTVTAAAVATGAIDADALAADVVTDIWQGTALTEAYAADGAAATPAQLLYMIWSALAEFSISGTTITAKKLDGSTTAMTFTLDSSTTPTSRTRAT